MKSIQDAGQRAMMADGGKSTTRKRKLDDMTRLWNEVREKSNHRHEELEDALKEVHTFSVMEYIDELVLEFYQHLFI